MLTNFRNNQCLKTSVKQSQKDDYFNFVSFFLLQGKTKENQDKMSNIKQTN